MDISTFHAVTSATCFALVGLWWSVVKDKPEWFTDEAMKRMAGGVYASFLLPSVMSLGAQIGVGVHDCIHPTIAAILQVSKVHIKI